MQVNRVLQGVSADQDCADKLLGKSESIQGCHGVESIVSRGFPEESCSKDADSEGMDLN